MDAQKTLDLATIEGARALGIQDEVGSIEVGKKADIIMLDMHSPNLNPIHAKETIISDLVYSASPANVDTTIVDGQPLMVNRKLLTLDIQQTIQNAAKVANELVHP